MKIIIAGAYAIGIHLAKLLSRNNEDITLMDEDLDRLSHINDEYDLLTMEANPSSIEAMKEAGVEHADLYIGVTPDEALNLNCCIMAKALGAKKTVAKIDNPEFTDPKLQAFFDNLGVSSLIYPEMLAAIDINNGLKMSWVRQRWDVHDGALVMLVIKLREECEILNEPLKNICGPNDPFHIVAIKRQGETIIPGGNDELKLFDMAYFMTTKNYIPYIRTIVGKEHYADVKNVMVMGAGQTAVRAIKTMPNYMGVKIIEIDNQRCQELNNILDDNVLVINGDGRDVPLLIEEGIKNTQAFVALTGNAETNILACLTAKRLGVRKTVAMVENTDYVAMAENLDIGTIINRKTIAASLIYQMMLDADVMNVRFLDSANADVAEFIVQEGAKVTKHPVKDLGMPIGVTIGGLVRQGEGMLVSGNTQIMPGDSVMVFCHNINMKKIEKYFIS
jgi:trk system potassium uptake protein TrkA